jgi:hypothetical protein
MSDDDSIEIRVRLPPPPERIRVTIGNTVFEFPEGTTREQAQSVLDEAKARYLRMLGLTPFKKR